MTLEIHIRQKMSCPRHPRYNPERDGEAGIKGGCAFCVSLFVLREKTTVFANDVQRVADAIVAERHRACE